MGETTLERCAAHGVVTRVQCVSCGTPICLRCQTATETGLRCFDCAAKLGVEPDSSDRRGPAPQPPPVDAAVPGRRARVALIALVLGAVLLAGFAAALWRALSSGGSSEPATYGQWHAAPDLTAVRGPTVAVALPDGRVLAVVTNFANKFDPQISVAPNGRVDVGWYDFRNDDGHMLVDVYATYSNDAGATWAPNVRITDRSADRRPGFFVDGGAVRGPLGVASDNYAAHFAFEDTRNATDEDPVSDIYAGAIQFKALPGPSSRAGLETLAAVGGGLLTTAFILLLASVIASRRRAAGT